MSQEKKLNPMALSAGDAAKTLGIPREWDEQDVAAGAPTNPACERSEQTGSEAEGRVPKGCDGEAAHNADSTLNLVHYAAWLNKQMAASTSGGQ